MYPPPPVPHPKNKKNNNIIIIIKLVLEILYSSQIFKSKQMFFKYQKYEICYFYTVSGNILNALQEVCFYFEGNAIIYAVFPYRCDVVGFHRRLHKGKKKKNETLFTRRPPTRGTRTWLREDLSSPPVEASSESRSFLSRWPVCCSS